MKYKNGYLAANNNSHRSQITLGKNSSIAIFNYQETSNSAHTQTLIDYHQTPATITQTLNYINTYPFYDNVFIS